MGGGGPMGPGGRMMGPGGPMGPDGPMGKDQSYKLETLTSSVFLRNNILYSSVFRFQWTDGTDGTWRTNGAWRA